MDEIILTEKNGKILASSREVAEKFGKKHSEVIYAIEGREAWDQLKGKKVIKHTGLLMGGHDQLLNMFIKTEYIDTRGRIQYEYLMNRDGFSLLVMGFTGKDALEWKLKFIEAFNQMEEKLKSGSYLSEEEKLKLQLFSKDPSEVAYAHNRLVELATAPLIAENEEMKPKAEYHDEVLKKDGLITTTIVAKDLGFSSANKLNKVMNANHIIFKNQSGTWCPYADYESYTNEHSKPCLKWTEKGRKWIVENYNQWVMNLAS